MMLRTKILSFLLVLCLLSGLVVAAAPEPQARSARIQPVLVEDTGASPEAMVAVIVQKRSSSTAPEAWVTAHGGMVTNNLPMIGAFAAALPAGHLRALAARADVGWVSLDAQVADAGCRKCVDTKNLKSAYASSVRADRLWNEAPYLQGEGISVAVLDSGISTSVDLNKPGNRASRIEAKVFIKAKTRKTDDAFGHGTHVAGLIGGNGALSRGAYIGIAPKVNLLNVKVTDDEGMANESDVIAGLQWVYDHREQYNIRVVNLSLNSTSAQSYHTSPMNAAIEILWFNGVVVVVSAGNNGTSESGVVFPPANDPFAITVGAARDMGTPDLADDTMASFSAFGVTSDGIAKPDLVAPGSNLIGLLSNPRSVLARAHPDHKVGGIAGPAHYFRMSGTSTSAAVVAGAVALLLQDEPGLTPDQVKYRLMATANRDWPGYDPAAAGAGYLDVSAAVYGATTEPANTGVTASQLLWTGPSPVLWGSVAWNSVAWNSVAWNSVAWNSVAWNSVAWNSDYWEQENK